MLLVAWYLRGSFGESPEEQLAGLAPGAGFCPLNSGERSPENLQEG
jgi:hypothetical protein